MNAQLTNNANRNLHNALFLNLISSATRNALQTATHFCAARWRARWIQKKRIHRIIVEAETAALARHVAGVLRIPRYTGSTGISRFITITSSTAQSMSPLIHHLRSEVNT